MPKIKKLPSGSWHCQVYSHTERTWNPDKKAWDEHRVYESFTGYDKKAVQAQAALFAHEKNRMKRPDRIKVIEAVQKYIDSKDGVLSPATIRGYQSILKNYLDDISQIELRDLTSEDLQLWIQKVVSDSANYITSSNPDYVMETLQYVVVIISIVPIYIAFPFFIKKLEKGMVLGAVKE